MNLFKNNKTLSYFIISDIKKIVFISKYYKIFFENKIIMINLIKKIIYIFFFRRWKKKNIWYNKHSWKSEASDSQEEEYL